MDPWDGGPKAAFDTCSVEGCGRPHDARGLCNTHLARFQRHGDPHVQRRKTPAASHINAGGYRVLNGGVLEHRAVMASRLRRSLLSSESVHHINGNRHDNRLENLELWSSSQPAGQRVEDKADWALEILRLYRPEALIDPF